MKELEWTNEVKILLLEFARKDLIQHAYWGQTPDSLECLDEIIQDYKEKQND